MGGEDNRGAVEAMWEAFARKDFEAAAESMADDFVEDWPQSGERIAGKENWLSIVKNFPGGVPDATPVRLVGEGDVWVQELLFDYRGDVGTYHVCAVHEFRDGKMAAMTEYFGPPFEPAEWRAQWIERIES